MKFSKETLRFSDSLIFQYAKLKRGEKSYTVDENDIPDFDLHKLAVLIMYDEPDISKEACSVDNPAWGKMQSAMLRSINSVSVDDQLEFSRVWKEGITSYCTTTIWELLQDALEKFKHEKRFYDKHAASM